MLSGQGNELSLLCRLRRTVQYFRSVYAKLRNQVEFFFSVLPSAHAQRATTYFPKLCFNTALLFWVRDGAEIMQRSSILFVAFTLVMFIHKVDTIFSTFYAVCELIIGPVLLKFHVFICCLVI